MTIKIGKTQKVFYNRFHFAPEKAYHMNDIQKEFFFYYDSLQIDQPALCIALNLQRSTLSKWLSGKVTNIPAVAISAMKLLWFMQKSSPDLFHRWIIIQEYGVTGDASLDVDNQNLLMNIKKKPRAPIARVLRNLK